MDDEFRRRLDEALREMPPLDTGPSVGDHRGEVPLTVTKASAWVMCSTELLTGESTRPPVRWGWRVRLRWRVWAWRERAARVAYRVIAGEWPHEPDPCDE